MRVIHFLSVLLILFLSTRCADDQNSFLPYKPVDFYISLANYNHLTIPGNSITFPQYGFAGIIVMCVNSNEYYAYDASCPYEKLNSCRVEAERIDNLGSNGLIFSSSPSGKCKCCGSEYMLFGGGYSIKGPSSRPLQQYQVVQTGGRLQIHN